MAKIKLDVPVLAQEKTMCCWHTSAMMIWRYWQEQTGRQGPMNTVTPVYQSNAGLAPSAQAFITLARMTGLLKLPVCTTYSSAALSDMLRDHGPVWCAGLWYGAGHVIVLTGIDGGQVFLNDPDGAQRKTGTLAWFNKKLLKGLDGCLMAKDPAAY
ncbi:MAG: C39 family peptidase [Pseudomonadota bacterium]|nr:C39 family peptidase [Pseudomonadota bacterium]